MFFKRFIVGIKKVYRVPAREMVYYEGCLLKFINAPAHGDQVLPFHCHVPRAAFLGVRAHRHRGVSACVSRKRTAAPGAAVRSAPRPAAEPEAEKAPPFRSASCTHHSVEHHLINTSASLYGVYYLNITFFFLH